MDRSDWLPAEELNAIRVIKARFDLQLQGAAAAGNFYKYRKLAEQLLVSPACKMLSLFEANRQLRVRYRWSIADLREARDMLHPARPTLEDVVVRVEERRGKQRPVVRLGILNRALHTLMRWALEPWIRARMHKGQFMFRGGRRAATRCVQAIIQDGRYKHAAELDVRDCYPSINLDWVAGVLPVNKQWLLNILSTNAHKIVPIDRNAGHLFAECRSGLMQGSPLSSLIAEFVIGAALSDAQVAGVAISFADNIQLLAKTRFELECDVSSLCAAFARHPSGKLRLRTSDRRRVADGFDYLGYRHRRVGGIATVVPSEKAKRAFTDRYIAKIRDAMGGLISWERALAYPAQWANAFSEWRSAKNWSELVVRPNFRPSYESIWKFAVETADVLSGSRSLIDLMHSL